jgi:hypothetical protein
LARDAAVMTFSINLGFGDHWSLPAFCGASKAGCAERLASDKTFQNDAQTPGHEAGQSGTNSMPIAVSDRQTTEH